MEEQSHHCNTRTVRQNTPSRDLKRCDGGNQSRLPQTAHSILRLSHGEGGEGVSHANVRKFT
eukprot:10799709-Ditylum_brightwellii.AAC.1